MVSRMLCRSKGRYHTVSIQQSNGRKHCSIMRSNLYCFIYSPAVHAEPAYVASWFMLLCNIYCKTRLILQLPLCSSGEGVGLLAVRLQSNPITCRIARLAIREASTDSVRHLGDSGLIALPLNLWPWIVHWVRDANDTRGPGRIQSVKLRVRENIIAIRVWVIAGLYVFFKLRPSWPAGSKSN